MTSIKKVVCGVKEPKKNERRGTMKECAGMKQVRYFGVKKIDKVLLDKMMDKPRVTVNYTLVTARGTYTGLESRIERLTAKLETAERKNKIDDIKKIKKDIRDAEKEKAKMKITLIQLIKAKKDKEDKEGKSTKKKK